MEWFDIFNEISFEPEIQWEIIFQWKENTLVKRGGSSHSDMW